MTDTLRRLADHLERQRDDILSQWIRISRGDSSLPVVSRLTNTEFEDHAPSALASLTVAFRQDSVEASAQAIRDEVAKHGHHRWKQGFNLEELTRDWGHLNGVLIEFVDRQLSSDHSPDAGESRSRALHILATFMTEAMSSSVRRFDELRRAEAESRASDIETLRDEFERITRERAELLREAVHDLRGGLSRIAVTSALMRLKDRSNESISDLTARLERSVGSQKQMINALLDLSRLESGAESLEVSEVDIARHLRSLAEEHESLAQEKGIRLVTGGPDQMLVATDPGKVRRIAQNLLTNALNYTKVGEVTLTWRRDDRRWLMIVKDTGEGIQDERGSAIAEQLNSPELADSSPSHHVGFAGEGIGLTIVKRLCEMLDAGITLESTQGEGTTVTVAFSLDID